MTEIPQPAREPYSVGNRVRIYIGSDDMDAHYHGITCEITDVLIDDLDGETGRRLDAYTYRLRVVETGETLPISFRHRDLVPADPDL